MTISSITADGKYRAQCRQCGAWVEVHPETVKADLFFEILRADYCCCGVHQSAQFTVEKDSLDFH